MKKYLFVLVLLVAVNIVTVPSHLLAADNPAANSVIEIIHLNQATAEELQALPGVGPALSERIITYRQEHGPFGSVEQLAEVKGIGQAKLTKLRDHLKVN